MVELRKYILADNAHSGKFNTASTEFALDALADAGDGDKVTFYVASSLEEAVTIQVIGQEFNNPGT